MAEHSEWFAEWGKVPLSWTGLWKGFSPHDPSPFYILLAILATAVIAGVLQKEIGGALLLLGAGYEGVQHLRMQALMACIVVIVGGSLLSPVVEWIGAQFLSARTRFVLAASASMLFVAAGSDLVDAHAEAK